VILLANCASVLVQAVPPVAHASVANAGSAAQAVRRGRERLLSGRYLAEARGGARPVVVGADCQLSSQWHAARSHSTGVVRGDGILKSLGFETSGATKSPPSRVIRVGAEEIIAHAILEFGAIPEITDGISGSFLVAAEAYTVAVNVTGA